jgi:hypothetical protein
MSSNSDKPTFLRKGSDPRAVVALFGDPLSPRVIKRVFEIADRLLRLVGYPANVTAIHSAKRHGHYRRATESALRAIEREDLSGFALAYAPPPHIDAVKFGFLEVATTTSGVVVTARSDLLLPRNVIIPFVLDVATVFPIRYGYHYEIDAIYGPAYHAVGLFQVRAGHDGVDAPQTPAGERERTSAWRNRSERLMPLGHLRDVFPLNFLTTIHRQRKMENTPLFEWIAADPSRGTLQEIAIGLWAWQVPSGRCAELGNEFEAAGMLTSGEMNAPPPPNDFPTTPEGIATYARAKLGAAIRATRDGSTDRQRR